MARLYTTGIELRRQRGYLYVNFWGRARLRDQPCCVRLSIWAGQAMVKETKYGLETWQSLVSLETVKLAAVV